LTSAESLQIVKLMKVVPLHNMKALIGMEV